MIERQSQQLQLNLRGFDNIDAKTNGQTWIKTTVAGMHGNLAELLNAAKKEDGVRGVEEIQRKIAAKPAEKCTA